MSYDFVVVGTSWGGLDALTRIVSKLTPDLGAAVAIIQHRGKDSAPLLGRLLQDHASLPVMEIEDKEPIRPGTIYIAPADYHVLVEADSFSLTTDEPVRYSRPSIDVAFSSVADTFGQRAIGVVLTGANVDGSEGLRRIVDRGGHGVVQDPGTAEMAVMPRAAMRLVPEAAVMPVRDIGGYLSRIVRRSHLAQAHPA